MASLPIKELLNVVVTELRGATSTHLNDSSLKVYKGDQSAWRYRKGVFVVWAGMVQEPASILGQWDDIQDIWVLIRQTAKDPNEGAGRVSDDAWYDDFLELCEEVIVELGSVTNRNVTGAGGVTSNSMRITSVDPGYDSEGQTEMLVCRIVLAYNTPRD